MPSNNQSLEDIYSSLEAVMVNAFRLCESLYDITKEERQTLLEGKADVLLTLAKKKETVLNQIEINEEARRNLTGQLAVEVGSEPIAQTLSDVVKKLPQSEMEQITRLQQGILALQAEIRELNNGNYALATLNLSRLEAMQGYIMGLFSTPNYYRPAANMPTVEPPASWGVEHLA